MDRTVLFIQTTRLECCKCQRVLKGSLPGIGPRCDYPKSFARKAVDPREMMTIRAGAELMGVISAVIRSINTSQVIPLIVFCHL